MKKTMVVLFVTVILLFSIPAFADGETDLSQMETSELTALYGNVLVELGRRTIVSIDIPQKTDAPILFRNIPWGASATSFLSIMNSQELSGSIRDASYCYSWEFKPEDGEIKPVDSMGDSAYIYSCSPKGLSVGGFVVESINAYFLFTHDDKDVFSEKEKSALYRAQYDFKVVDGQASYAVLSSKMGALYGEGATGTNSTGWWSTGGDYHTYCDWTTWYGAENTGVVLCHVYETYDDDSTVKNDEVYLLYGKVDSLTMMSDLKAAQARVELETAMQSGDMSGL